MARCGVVRFGERFLKQARAKETKPTKQNKTKPAITTETANPQHTHTPNTNKKKQKHTVHD
jgi:hypothetical protein